MIAGVFITLGGLLFTFLGQAMNLQDLADQMGEEFAQLIGSMFTVIGVVIIIFGALLFLLGLGLWKLNFIAWIVAVVLHGIPTLAIVLKFQFYLNAISAGAFSMLVNPIITIAILAYLIMVRDAFK